MSENITTGEIPFRKAYIRSLVDRIEIDDHVVRIIGDKATRPSVSTSLGWRSSSANARDTAGIIGSCTITAQRGQEHAGPYAGAGQSRP
jgi:hypothetical protein